MLIPFTRMRSCRRACAAFLVRVERAPFEDAYPHRYGCPPWLVIVMMLTTEPCLPVRFISSQAACIRRNGARALTAKRVSHDSTDWSRSPPREVSPAQLASPSIEPNAFSCAGTTAFTSSTESIAARTNCARQPSVESFWTTAAPRSLLRPTIVMPDAPSEASLIATASPTPDVPPVTTNVFPAKRAGADSRAEAQEEVAAGDDQLFAATAVVAAAAAAAETPAAPMRSARIIVAVVAVYVWSRQRAVYRRCR
mmetsp:Transcript_10380/g.26980  ORF Transcript_10380/g.26980 Transcript_10380/m.26980 type:complete len:253 (+) Transcript_10380:494-1252(+)